MTRFTFNFLLFISLIFFFNDINAQWNTKLSFGSSYYSGNVDKFDLRADGAVTRKDSLIESKLFGKIIYSESNGVQNNEEYSGGVKFDYKPKNKLTPFILLSLYKNQFKKIDMRLSALAGAKYVIYRGLDSLNKVVSDYSISAAIEYDKDKYTKYTDSEGIEIQKDPKEKMRLSIRPKIKQRLSSNIYFEHITFYQPNMKDFDDYLLNSITSISTKITKKIDFGISYEYDYESKPVSETVKKTNQVILAKLTIKI